MNCNCCGSTDMILLFERDGDTSITTMNATIPGKTKVYYCGVCSHAQTESLMDLKDYYENVYELGRLGEEDDQLYETLPTGNVYRAEHQAKVFQEKVKPQKNTKVLDYGCGKSLTMSRVCKKVEGFQPYLFDVSNRYLPIWSQFTDPERCFLEEIPNTYLNYFDVVSSFYALEHIDELDECLEAVRNVLVDGGLFYFIVPNVLENYADLIVADHANHFTESSLTALLVRNGFESIVIDAECHSAAFIITARKTEKLLNPEIPVIRDSSLNYDKLVFVSEFWKDQEKKLRTKVKKIDQIKRVGIYGAGFYGAFIDSLTHDLNAVIDVFVDRNEYLHGTTVNGKKVVSVADAAANLDILLVGLNPIIAKKVIQDIDELKGQEMEYIFLD